MQFWKGQRVLVNGEEFGTVYQDQGLNYNVVVVLDSESNVARTFDPRDVSLITSRQEEEVMSNFLNRRYWP